VTAGEVTVNAAKCLRCGACASLVPGVFSLRGGDIAILRQPADTVEREIVRAAVLVCPSLAIVWRDGGVR
jgi:ferredoxin